MENMQDHARSLGESCLSLAKGHSKTHFACHEIHHSTTLLFLLPDPDPPLRLLPLLFNLLFFLSYQKHFPTKSFSASMPSDVGMSVSLSDVIHSSGQRARPYTHPQTDRQPCNSSKEKKVNPERNVIIRLVFDGPRALERIPFLTNLYGIPLKRGASVHWASTDKGMKTHGRILMHPPPSSA
ncbi:unnamed protein product [Protopolystoma xenopodis]|uniref:Uncharacterized protein n=1 Tax=Protopolystoma xenopodis TaxID=117903 RepID=A0A448XPI4_9PLAT|nr:unnamed protein product [Protopolystoma xenopodis]